MKHSIQLLFITIVVLLSNLPAQSRFPRIGSRAPTISVKEWVTGETSREKPSRGKFIILEFWASWCAPCISAIPHLNELAEKFTDKKLVFVSLTAEDRPIVEKFLTSHTMKSAVALDNNGTTHKAFGVEGIPHTFLIDAKGVLRWHGHPTNLNEEIVKDFLRSAKIPVPTHPTDIFSIPPEIEKSAFTLIVSSSKSLPLNAKAKGSMLTQRSGDTTKIVFRAGSIVDFVSKLFAIPDTRIEAENVPQDAIDLTLRVSRIIADSVLKQRAIDAVSDAYQIALQSERQTRKGWALSVADTNKLHPSMGKKGSTSTSFAKSKWIGSNVTVAVFLNALESSFQRHFFDDTGLIGSYDFEIPLGDLNELKSDLRGKYGLTLTEAEPAIEIKLLRKKKPSTE